MSNKKAPDTKAKLDWIARKGERERGRGSNTHNREVKLKLKLLVS